MSRIEWIGLPAAFTLVFLFFGYAMFLVRARYIYREVRSRGFPGGMQDRRFESGTYEVESYGCVSLLATVLGVLFYIIAAASFIFLLYQTVVLVVIPSLDSVISFVTVLFVIVLVLSFALFVTMLVMGFFKDLFNPPR